MPVVRAMPNTPCALGAGMTALCKGKFAKRGTWKRRRNFFDAVGRTVAVDEKHMDAVTAFSASGPAYIYIILESLAEAGVKVGLPRDIATLLAAQTTLGAATRGFADWRSPGAAERRGDYAGGMHYRRHHGIGRRQTAGDADQGGGESGAARQRTGVFIRRPRQTGETPTVRRGSRVHRSFASLRMTVWILQLPVSSGAEALVPIGSGRHG